MSNRPKVCFGSCKNFLVNTERCIGCDRSKPYPKGRQNWEPEDHIITNVTEDEVQILVDEGINHYPVNGDLTTISIVGDISYFKMVLHAIRRI